MFIYRGSFPRKQRWVQGYVKSHEHTHIGRHQMISFSLFRCPLTVISRRWDMMRSSKANQSDLFCAPFSRSRNCPLLDVIQPLLFMFVPSTSSLHTSMEDCHG